jgi:hypothetical protein
MDNRELAQKLITELGAFPSFTQNVIKGTIDTLAKEVNEGKALLSGLFESEDKFVAVLSEIIDMETQTGILDAFDRPIIERFVRTVVVGIMKKAFGDDWLADLQRFIGK